MKRNEPITSHLGEFSSGAGLGGKVSHYRSKQDISTQGAPAYTLFYIQEGGGRLTSRTKYQPSAVTAIPGVGDFFGELCLAGYPLHVSTAVALAASSIRSIKKKKMLQMLRKHNKTSNSLVAYLTRPRINMFMNRFRKKASLITMADWKCASRCGKFSGAARSNNSVLCTKSFTDLQLVSCTGCIGCG